MNSSKVKICAVIQATYESASYPGRCMAIVNERTVLDHIVSRIREMDCVADIVLATSNSRSDDQLVREAKRLKIRVVRGSKKDVISRLCKAMRGFQGDVIMRINGHSPLFDPDLAKILIEEHVRGEYDYSCNEHLYGTVYGTGCEIVQKRLIFHLDKENLTSEQREAGISFFQQNENGYRIYRQNYQNARPYYRVCIVSEKDVQLLNFIFKNVKNPKTSDVIRLLDNNPILVENCRQEPVKEVGLEKLYLFPDKIAGLRENNFQSPDIEYPISVELSLTNKCNLHCVWCSDKGLRNRGGDDMSPDVLKKLLLDLKKGGTKGIVIEGGGEPTIYKHFEYIVSLAYDLEFGIGLITNGSVSLKRKIADKFEWIRVSLDASNPEEKKALKKIDCFERVMSNIKSFCLSKATVGIGYVVTAKNIGSLDSLILRLSKFGARYIQFRPVIDHPELEANVDLSYLKRYQTRSFSVIIDGMHQNIIEGNSGLPCIAHSLTTVIAADGSVYLCGRLNIHDWLEPIGNINEEAFRNIWLGENRVRQIKMVKDAHFCKKFCPRCRLTKFNQLFHQLGRIKTTNFI